MNTETGTFRLEIKSLSPEILLKIFLNLESHETVILRSVCQEFLEVIDNNKSLWRILEWVQQQQESSIPALEMFDEKSASTLKEVSIFEKYGDSNDRLLEVLDRSKNSLTDLSLKLYPNEVILRLKIIEIASNFPLLKSLVLWPSDGLGAFGFPKTRLLRSCSQTSLDATKASNLQVLWYWKSLEDWKSKRDVLSSLASFADPVYRDPLELRSFISNFCQTVIHLSVSFRGQPTPSSLSCPNLLILEGDFPSSFPSWLDAPNLRIIIIKYFTETWLQSIPVSIEELWLVRYNLGPTADGIFDNLLQICPNLKTLKIGHNPMASERRRVNLLSILRARNEKVKNGGEVEGIKMKPLEKLVIQADLFQPAQLDELRNLVGAVIDIQDYQDFVEVEY